MVARAPSAARFGVGRRSTERRGGVQQQVRVIVATGEQIEKEIAQELYHGWSIVWPVQYGGQLPRTAGLVPTEFTVCIATLVREIP